MLTWRPPFRCGATDWLCSTEFFGSCRLQLRHNNGHGDRRINLTSSVQASHTSFGSRKGSASLAYMRSLSLNGRKPADPSTNRDSSKSRSVADEATVERLHLVISYSDLVLRRKLESGVSLIEASESGSENEYCWEDAWKLYMQSQTGTLKELAARMQECNPQIDSTISDSLPGRAPLPVVTKLRAKKLGRKRTRGLMLLNVLAALYGSSTVAAKFATDAAPGLPASLSSLVRYSSALLVFLPALHHVLLGRSKNPALLRAGTELGGLLFAAAVLETCGDGGASSDAPLLKWETSGAWPRLLSMPSISSDPKRTARASRLSICQPSSAAPLPLLVWCGSFLKSSQLKFPYYAAQAKRLLVEAKLKLLFVKSLVMSATSTLLTSTPPAPSGSLHSAAPGAIATSLTLQHVVSNSFLESAITALGSDIMQAVEEAEDIAKILEQAAQTAMDRMAMAAASATSLVHLVNSMSLETVKSVDITTTTALVDNSVDCAFPLVAHHAATVLQILLTCSSHPK